MTRTLTLVTCDDRGNHLFEQVVAPIGAMETLDEWLASGPRSALLDYVDSMPVVTLTDGLREMSFYSATSIWHNWDNTHVAYVLGANLLDLIKIGLVYMKRAVIWEEGTYQGRVMRKGRWHATNQSWNSNELNKAVDWCYSLTTGDRRAIFNKFTGRKVDDSHG